MVKNSQICSKINTELSSQKLFNTFNDSLRIFSPGFRDSTLWTCFSLCIADWSFPFSFAGVSLAQALNGGVTQSLIFGFILFSVYSLSWGILNLCKDLKYHTYDHWFLFFQLCPFRWAPGSKNPIAYLTALCLHLMNSQFYMTKTELLISCPLSYSCCKVSISISGTTIISAVQAKNIRVTLDFSPSFIPYH